MLLIFRGDKMMYEIWRKGKKTKMYCKVYDSSDLFLTIGVLFELRSQGHDAFIKEVGTNDGN